MQAAIRRIYYNRPVKGNPTQFGLLWQRAATSTQRTKMCEFFGVECEAELNQVAIDNYSSSIGKLDLEDAFVAFYKTLKQISGGLQKILDSVVNKPTVTDSSTYLSNFISPLPVTYHDLKTTVIFTSPNAFFITASLWKDKNIVLVAGEEAVFDHLPYVDYRQLAIRLYPFITNLWIKLKAQEVIFINAIETEIQIVLSTEFVSKLTNIPLRAYEGSAIGITLSIHGSIVEVKQLMVSPDQYPEMASIIEKERISSALEK